MKDRKPMEKRLRKPNNFNFELPWFKTNESVDNDRRP